MTGTEDSGIDTDNNQLIHFEVWKQKRKLWVAAPCVAATW